MSLFDDPDYGWRETYFVLFERARRPEAEATAAWIEQLKQRWDVDQIRFDEHGRLESLTLRDAAASAGMDVCYVAGRDVRQQVSEFLEERAHETGTGPDDLAARLAPCDARFEVYHFERQTGGASSDEAGLDPTALFELLQRLVRFCDGVAIDPQSATVVL